MKYVNEIDPRWLELILGVVGGDLTSETKIEGIRKQIGHTYIFYGFLAKKTLGAFVEVSEDNCFMGIFVPECSQVIQIKVKIFLSPRGYY